MKSVCVCEGKEQLLEIPAVSVNPEVMKAGLESCWSPCS